MEVRNIPGHVRQWMHEVEQNVTANNDRMVEFCDKIDQYANEKNDTFLKGYSLFYRGFNKYINAQLEEGMEVLSTALNHLITTESWELVSNAYNSMGNISYFQGDISLAIDCYLKGLALAIEYDINKIEYNLRTNIANAYIGLGSYDQALTMLLECDRLIEQGTVPTPGSFLAMTANMINCYIHLGITDKANKKLDILRKHCADDPSVINSLLCHILEAQLYHTAGDTQALTEACNALYHLNLSNIDVYDALNELAHHARLLLEVGRIDDFQALTKRLEEQASSPNVEQVLLDLQIAYYRKIGDYSSLAKKALKYYEVSELREQERNKIVSHNIITRMRLDEEARKRQEIERSNLLLKQKSEHDPLTGMNNRYKFNEIAELAFHKAQLNGTPLTVEFLDIDCYKEFNDNYGHQAGDECLIRIADAIRSMEEYAGIHTARYGGDEFVIIYEEYSQRDVERMAQRLHEKVFSLNIEHKFSKVSDRVSISQGIFHRIPAAENKIWDFLYCADMVLYGIKNQGKNSFHLDTSFDAIPRYNTTTPREGA